MAALALTLQELNELAVGLVSLTAALELTSPTGLCNARPHPFAKDLPLKLGEDGQQEKA